VNAVVNLFFVFIKTGEVLLPQRFKFPVRGFVRRAGYFDVPYVFFGFSFYLSVLFTFFSYFAFIFPNLSGGVGLIVGTLVSFVCLPFLFFGGFCFAGYGFVKTRIYSRTKKIESIFPEYLNLVSQNLKGGVPFERSLWLSVAPDFKVLKDEMYVVAKKVTAGQDLDEALGEFSDKYDSLTVRNSFVLIVEGIKGGGKIAHIIDQIVAELENTKELKKELTASNLTYVIFMWIVVFGIAPFILNIALLFLGLLGNFSTGESVPTAAGNLGFVSGLFSLGSAEVNFEEFRMVSRIVLGIIAFFCALMVSLIQKGSFFGAVRLLPLFIVGSQVSYWVVNVVASSIFGSLV